MIKIGGKNQMYKFDTAYTLSGIIWICYNFFSDNGRLNAAEVSFVPVNDGI